MNHAGAESSAGPRLRRPTGAPPLYAQDGKGYEAEVHAHYFVGGNDWLVTEYDPDSDIAFGWTCLGGDRQMAELGYVSLTELESVEIPLRIRDLTSGRVLESRMAQRVEREEGWPAPGLSLREAIAELDRRQGRG